MKRDYAVLLKDNGLKSTFQRTHILENIDALGHSSIDTIYQKITQIHPSLSLATVYKNIVLMVKKGVLSEVPILGQKSKYELSKAEHIHLICTQCGNVEDKAYTPNKNKLFDSLIEEENFKLNSQQINLYGVCKSCI